MSLSMAHIISIVATLALIMGLGVWSGRRVKNADDFNNGGKSAGTLLVAGTIAGTLVGGSSTIGTAELAYNFGFSAWWFTLGSCIGCLLLAAVYAIPVRRSECATIQEIISREYGKTAGLVTSILTSLGIVLNIVAQILAANALLGSMFGFSPVVCSVVSVVIMACYVLFGGIRGSGILGWVKMGLIYMAAVWCGVLALVLAGGFGGLRDALPATYFYPFARGFGKDFGAGLNVMLGVVSTQTYIQAVLMGRTNREAVRGCLVAAAMTPPVGLFSIFVGMYMRINFPGVAAAEAFPTFILDQLPAIPAGVAMAALLIAVVGTGSGMALGFGAIISNDIYKRFIDRQADKRRMLWVSRVIIMASLVFSAVFTLGSLGSAILTWGFLSMGLRAVVLLAPMTTALFLPGRIPARAAVAASCLGIAAMLAAAIIDLPFDALFVGMLAAALVLAVGLVMGGRRADA